MSVRGNGATDDFDAGGGPSERVNAAAAQHVRSGESWKSLPVRILALPIVGYRRGVSPLLGPRCRFDPPCSAYAIEALRRHGALRGSWLAVGRLARCHPFHPGGLDPVPPRVRKSRVRDVTRSCS